MLEPVTAYEVTVYMRASSVYEGAQARWAEEYKLPLFHTSIAHLISTLLNPTQYNWTQLNAIFNIESILQFFVTWLASDWEVMFYISFQKHL